MVRLTIPINEDEISIAVDSSFATNSGGCLVLLFLLEGFLYETQHWNLTNPVDCFRRVDVTVEEQYLVDGKWNEAINAFAKSNGDDAAERASVAYYENATALMQAGKNAEALLAYRKTGDYLDAKTCAAALEEQFNSRIIANSSVHTVLCLILPYQTAILYP